jgi:hypothetical protein
VPKTKKSIAERFWAFVDVGTPDACWPWKGTRCQPFGHGGFSVNGRTQKAHRVAFTLASGVIPAGLYVLHRCDNPSCCNPLHLFLGTQGDNNRDRASKGRNGDLRGSKSSRAKLSESEAAEILRRRRTGETITALAREYGVHHSAISRIALGQTWPHLGGLNDVRTA